MPRRLLLPGVTFQIALTPMSVEDVVPFCALCAFVFSGPSSRVCCATPHARRSPCAVPYVMCCTESWCPCGGNLPQVRRRNRWAAGVLHRIGGMMSAMTLWSVEMLLGVVGAVSAQLRRNKRLGRKGYISIIWSVKNHVFGICGCGSRRAWLCRTRLGETLVGRSFRRDPARRRQYCAWPPLASCSTAGAE